MQSDVKNKNKNSSQEILKRRRYNREFIQKTVQSILTLINLTEKT